MENRLSTNIEQADVVVDLSNIAWAEQIGGGPGPRLSRVATAFRALADHFGDDDLTVYAVVDESLLTGGRMPSADTARLRRWVDGHLVEMLRYADERILELAHWYGLPVLTRDAYSDHRREHPWIEDGEERFLEPVRDPGGTVRIRPRVMTPVAEWQQSRKIEEAELNERRLLRGDRKVRWDVLGRTWRCRDDRCVWFGRARAQDQPPPRVVRGRVVCHHHGTELIDAGPRPARVQVKVLVGGTVRSRFFVTEAAPVGVGRDPGPGGHSVRPWLAPEPLRRISRTHVVLRVQAGQLVVQDTSTNGTLVHVPARRGRAATTVRLDRGVRRQVGFGDRVELHPEVALERSGRRFPFDPTAGRGAPPGDDPSAGAPTVVLDPP